MMHTIAILTLFQLAAPSGVNALVSSPTLGYTLTGNRLVRLAGVPGACYTTADATTTEYTQAHHASAAQATLLVTSGTYSSPSFFSNHSRLCSGAGSKVS